ncbi:MAG: hypothetical protein V7L20_15095 [Nostoc sp.]
MKKLSTPLFLLPSDALSFDCPKIEFRLRGNRAKSRFNSRQVEIQLPLVVVSPAMY